MFNILSPQIEAFIENYTSHLPPYFKKIDTIGQNHPQSIMQSSYLQAQYLRFFSTLLKPKFILEIGTFLGMSALALAEGLDSDGQLHSIELDPISFANASNNVKLSPHASKIHLHLGLAIEMIPNLNLNFDLVFIDADKANYVNYTKAVLPKLSHKGLIIVDNIFYHGEIFNLDNTQNNVNGIRAFNDFVMQDPNLENIVLPIRDGLMLLKKKND